MEDVEEREEGKQNVHTPRVLHVVLVLWRALARRDRLQQHLAEADLGVRGHLLVPAPEGHHAQLPPVAVAEI
eukprot:COSAG05_NODE_2024_length_3677_cov_2.848239_4_plen_72_part_00